MGDFEVALRIEELLGTEGGPDGSDPALEAAWERQLRVHLLLYARFARGDEDATFASIRAAAAGSRRERIAEVIGRRSGRRMRRWSWDRLLPPLAAAALLLIAVQFGRSLLSTPTAPSDATAMAAPMVLDHVGPELVVERGPGRVMPEPGMPLHDGDLLATSAAGTSVRFSDGTRVEVAAGSRLTVSQQAGKSLRLHAGGLHAEVAPQPADQPLRIQSPGSQVQVVGTRFTLGMELVGTRLVVDDGTVRLARADGSQALAVTAGQQAVGSGFHAPALTTPFDPARLRVRLAVPCDNPAAWTENLYGPVTATAQPQAGATAALRLAVSPSARDGWGSRGLRLRLAGGDRALAVRLRVNSAKPGAVIAFDLPDEVDNTWRVGEMPLAAGAGWQQLYIPFPPPADPPPRTMTGRDPAFLVQRVNVLWVYFHGVAEVELGSLTVLSDPAP